MRVIAEFPRRAIVNHTGDDFYFNSEVTNTIPGQANPQVFNFKIREFQLRVLQNIIMDLQKFIAELNTKF
ncbi:MAG: hypothetical protein CM15mV120_300 [uncultured marine virus]|nr:MAG: hypothetical protein CM15mV120_300 [uncultured marine virus]